MEGDMFNIGDVFKCQFSLFHKSFKYQIITNIVGSKIIFYRNDRKTYTVDSRLLEKNIKTNDDHSYGFVGNMLLINFYEKYSRK